jgi:hypothetical protein
MEVTTVLSITGPFMRFVGETLAEAKSQRLDQVTLEMLRLKRVMMAERLEECQTNVERFVKVETGRVLQDHISRGLGNSTVLTTTARSVVRDADEQLIKATREYNRAIEELALLERQVRERPSTFWRRLLGTAS